MTREQIEKAARIERENVHKELQDNYRKHKDINFYTAFSATIDMYAVPLFKAGAKWRINSAWHNRYENADVDNGDILLLFPDGSAMTKSVIGWSWEDIKDMFAFDKWAYVKDLIPTKEE